MHLSPHFSLRELTFSLTAEREGFDNTPRAVDVLHHLRILAWILEDVRALCGDHALYVLSGYRCPALNAEVGGHPFSAHLSGRAADFHPPAGWMHDQLQQAIAKSEIQFDELYEERSADGGHWLHLSIPRTGHPARRRVRDFALDRVGGTIQRVTPG